MKKVRYSLIALAVIVILICVSFRVAGLSLYQEKVQHRIENVLHYGPSDEVLFKFTRPDGFGIIVSKCGDEGISVIRTKRILYLPYKPTGMPGYDGTGYLPCNDQICVRYDDLLDMIYGIDFDHPEEDILVEIGTEQRQLFQQRVTTDEKGFFHINDISTLSQLDMYDIQDEFYVYAESVLPVEDTDIRINSNMPRGLVADRSELDKLIPPADEFMSEEDMESSSVLGSDVLNKINAGIKKYTGIDFFAYEGVSDGETLCLYYDHDPWADDGLVLKFRKDGDRFVPVASDENMDVAAVSWLHMNYGKRYDVRSVSSKKIEVTEKDGKKQYRTLLSSYLSLRSNGVSGEMNVEVVVEADLNDPAAPWKMYYVSESYGNNPPWELRDISELTIPAEDEYPLIESNVGDNPDEISIVDVLFSAYLESFKKGGHNYDSVLNIYLLDYSVDVIDIADDEFKQRLSGEGPFTEATEDAIFASVHYSVTIDPTENNLNYWLPANGVRAGDVIHKSNVLYIDKVDGEYQIVSIGTGW